MRETPISSSERSFLRQSLRSGLRMDERELRESRDAELHYGIHFGTCTVRLGQTVVYAQVSSSLSEPLATRPNEGLLSVQVDFGPTAAPRFAGSEGSSDYVEEQVELTRMLERALRESRCLDLESLCVVSESIVWRLQLELSVMNHAGNALTCASVAALAALAHFKRPQVTVENDVPKVHSMSERDPVPLTLHHFPICTSYALYRRDEANEESTLAVMDPTYVEEAVADGKLVFAVNTYRELCALHFEGGLVIDKDAILAHAHRAADEAKRFVGLMKRKLEQDEKARKEQQRTGLAADTIGFAAALAH